MRKPEGLGFTLIELLTVIAIIAILAGLVMIGAPRALENAKIAKQQSNMRALHTSLSAYATDHGSYPPMYGYKRANPTGNQPAEKFYLTPYMRFIGEETSVALFDQFSMSFDLNANGLYEVLEYVPPPNEPQNQLNPPDPMSPGAGVPEGQRPIAYIPVNSSDVDIFKKYCERRGFFLAEQWDPNDPGLTRLRFPNTQYDRFVLVSVGPVESCGGVVVPPAEVLQNYINAAGAAPNLSIDDLYHMLALRAYYLATRDVDANGRLDFDFMARSREGEAGVEVEGVLVNAGLPDPNARPPLWGPLIYVP